MEILEDEKIIILDTETTNSLDDPIVYDIGFAVINPFTGKVLESFSFINADVFLDKQLMESAYFIEKIPKYWEDIKAGKRVLKSYYNIKRIFNDVCKKYNITKIAAHNAYFDYRSLTLTQRIITTSKYRYFLPYGCEIVDTLKMARQVFGKDDDYGDFCYNNNFLTSTGRRQFTAEVLYKYLTGNVDFEESHTGLEDVMIEKDIFVYCFNKNPEIDGTLWAKNENK